MATKLNAEEKVEVFYAGRNTKKTPRQIATIKIRQFESSQRALNDFIFEHLAQEQLEALFELIDKYNSDLADAKDAIRNVSSATPVQIGAFQRAKNTKETVTYNPKYIPNRILAMPGVVKSVDTKKINELILSGEITVEDMEDAKEMQPGRTPSVRAPKAVVFDT